MRASNFLEDSSFNKFLLKGIGKFHAWAYTVLGMRRESLDDWNVPYISNPAELEFDYLLNEFCLSLTPILRERESRELFFEQPRFEEPEHGLDE